MAASSGPDIIDDGLIFCVDAKNTKSYPGSGTTLTDIADKKTNTISGATFGDGVFSFDGSNDRIDCGNILSW